MSEDNTAEQEALSMGWIPKEQFKGDPEKWVDAESFVRRGKEFVPFLKANNKKLETELSSVKGELTRLSTLLKASQETIDTLKEFNSQQNREKVQEKKEQLLDRLKEARESGDVKAEEQIREQLDETRDALKASDKKPEDKTNGGTAQPVDYTQRPEWKQFVEENPWWTDNRRMRAVAVDIASELRESDEGKSLSPTEFFRKVAAETKKLFESREQVRERAPSKVEGSKGGGGDGGGARGRSFADLPQDAKDACDRYGARLVGEGRAYKTLKDWREAYVKQYQWE